MNWILFKFIALGPAIGCIVFNGVKEYPGLLERLSTTASPLMEIGSFFLGAVFVGVLGLFLAYPLGGLPAAASGFAYWFVLKRYTSTNPNWAMRIIIGSIIGFFITSAYGGLLFAPQNKELVMQAFLSWSVAGSIAGALCAFSIGEKTYLQVNEV